MEPDSLLTLDTTIIDIYKYGIESLGTIILQLIITSAGLLTFTVTFVEKLKSFGKKASIYWLILSWCLLALSILVGFFALYRYTGNLLDFEGSFKPDTLNLATVQYFLFTFAITSILIFAIDSTIQFVAKIKEWISQVKSYINNSKSVGK